MLSVVIKGVFKIETQIIKAKVTKAVWITSDQWIK